MENKEVYENLRKARVAVEKLEDSLSDSPVRAEAIRTLLGVFYLVAVIFN